MSVIYVLLPVGILFAAGFVWAFIRAARKGQFDDLTTPAIRILHDDDPTPPRGRPASPRARTRPS